MLKFRNKSILQPYRLCFLRHCTHKTMVRIKPRSKKLSHTYHLNLIICIHIYIYLNKKQEIEYEMQAPMIFLKSGLENDRVKSSFFCVSKMGRQTLGALLFLTRDIYHENQRAK